MTSITRKLIRELHKGSIALSCPAGTDTRGRAGDRSLVHRFGAAPFFVFGVGAIFFLIPVFINGFPRNRNASAASLDAHYNEAHPHKALGYRSPREFIAAHARP